MQKKILDWYKINHRKLPWRENTDPYRIWISEIMLQQTQVITVIDYFNRFVKKYPTVGDLANADEDSVLKLWEGLGYYSRARRLIPCAKMLIEDFDGSFPKDYSQMLKLPGIGSYTAGAVLSIAFNMKLPAVDGNVMRVYSRVFDMDNDVSDAKSKKVFEEKVYETLPNDRRHYNQALMELGARICTPKNPKCMDCPIQSSCSAFKKGNQAHRPIKTKKIKKRHENIAVCCIKCDGKILLMKRPGEGLLAGMWAFPCVSYETSSEGIIEDYLMNNFQIHVHDLVEKSFTKHVYTHLVWHMTLYEMTIEKQVVVDYPQVNWVRYSELKDYALPKGFHKLLDNRDK